MQDYSSLDLLPIHLTPDSSAADSQKYVSAAVHKRRKFDFTTEFCPVVPNICRSSDWNLRRVTVLAPRILRCLIEIWRNYAPHFVIVYR